MNEGGGRVPQGQMWWLVSCCFTAGRSTTVTLDVKNHVEARAPQKVRREQGCRALFAYFGMVRYTFIP